MMKRFNFLIFTLIIVLVTSCEGSELFVKCSDCHVNEPYEATLKCRVNSDSRNGVLLQIWEGKLEDSIFIDSRRLYSHTVFERRVPLNIHYTITATYIIDNKTYLAVNSTTPRLKRTDSKCDKECFFVYNNEVDLRLKYKD